MENYNECAAICSDARLICQKIAEFEAIWRKANRQVFEVSRPETDAMNH
jgi:hypothetical protein